MDGAPHYGVRTRKTRTESGLIPSATEARPRFAGTEVFGPETFTIVSDCLLLPAHTEGGHKDLRIVPALPFLAELSRLCNLVQGGAR